MLYNLCMGRHLTMKYSTRGVTFSFSCIRPFVVSLYSLWRVNPIGPLEAIIAEAH